MKHEPWSTRTRDSKTPGNYPHWVDSPWLTDSGKKSSSIYFGPLKWWFKHVQTFTAKRLEAKRLSRPTSNRSEDHRAKASNASWGADAEDCLLLCSEMEVCWRKLRCSRTHCNCFSGIFWVFLDLKPSILKILFQRCRTQEGRHNVAFLLVLMMFMTFLHFVWQPNGQGSEMWLEDAPVCYLRIPEDLYKRVVMCFSSFFPRDSGWLSHPSEKYESQLGWLSPIYGKIKSMFQTTNQDWPSHPKQWILKLQYVRSVDRWSCLAGDTCGNSFGQSRLRLQDCSKDISSTLVEILKLCGGSSFPFQTSAEPKVFGKN